MLSDEKVQAALAPFECVEWQYDGLKGSVIEWTKKHGSTNDDPSVLVWVLDAQENVVGGASPEEYGGSGQFVDWLGKMKEEHGKKAGRAPAGGSVEWKVGTVKEVDTGTGTILEGLDVAKQEKRPALIYVFIPADKAEEKPWQAARKDCEKLEKGALADPELAKLAARCFTVKLVFTEVAVQKFVKKSADVTKAPAVYLIDWKKMGSKPQQWSNPKMRAVEIIRALKPIAPKDEAGGK